MVKKVLKFSGPVENVAKIVVKLNGDVVVSYYLYKQYKNEILQQLQGYEDPGVTYEYLELSEAEKILYGQNS